MGGRKITMPVNAGQKKFKVLLLGGTDIFSRRQKSLAEGEGLGLRI